MKDAYYFPHFSNARHDRKIKRLTKELGIEGYGIFFMVLEILREQVDFKYPLSDIDLLSDEIGTSEAKVNVVICNYQLFEIDAEQRFFSPKLLVYLQPYLRMKEQRRIAGVESGKARALTAKTPKEEVGESPQVYIIRCFRDDEQFIKIGTTKGKISRRLSGHLPYKYEVVRQIFAAHSHANRIECELRTKFAFYEIKPCENFPGEDGCYNICILSDILDYKPTYDFSHERVLAVRSNTNGFRLNENEQSKRNKVNSKVKSISANNFIPPTLDDIKNYIAEKNYSTDPLSFYNYFSEGNWTDSKGNKVKNWKQKIITWESHNGKKNTIPATGISQTAETTLENWRKKHATS